MVWSFFILALIGFVISLYTYVIEQKVAQDASYKPVCDISDVVSCTKPMKSSYSAIFFVSNALVSMSFYLLVAVLAVAHATTLLLIATSVAFIVTCIFAYVLYLKIRALCLLCTSLYVINIILLVLSIQSWRI